MGGVDRVRIDPILLEALRKAASAGGWTVEELVNRAVADRIAPTDPDAYWAFRADRARASDLKLSDLLNRAANERPIPGDEIDDHTGPRHGRDAAE